MPHGRDTLLRVQTAGFVNEHRFTGGDVTQGFETEHIERDRLGGEHVLKSFGRLARTENERTNAVRIAKTQDAVTDHHRDDRIAAATTTIQRRHCSENVSGGDTRCTHALQLGSEHVEQHFGIRRGVEMPSLFSNENFGQLGRVREIAIVTKHDAIRRIHVERLRLRCSTRSRGGITHVTDADVAAVRDKCIAGANKLGAQLR